MWGGWQEGIVGIGGVPWKATAIVQLKAQVHFPFNLI